MKRLAVLVGIVAGVTIGSKLLVEDVMGINLVDAMSAWLGHAGAGGALTVVILLAADIVLPVPSSVVMVLSGAAFGVVWGSMLSLVGSIGGEWLGFELTRKYGRRFTGKLIDDAEIERLRRIFERHGVAAVVITRALPVVMETMSVVAGLSGMSRSAFLVASVLGTTPIVMVYAYAGALSREWGASLQRWWFWSRWPAPDGSGTGSTTENPRPTPAATGATERGSPAGTDDASFGLSFRWFHDAVIPLAFR